MSEPDGTDKSPDETGAAETGEAVESNGDGRSDENGTTNPNDSSGEAEEADGNAASESTAALLDAVDAVSILDDEDIDPETITVDAPLNEQVETAPLQAVAQTLTVLDQALMRIDTERGQQRERADELESRLRRKQAEFQNYKKRQTERLEEEKARATEDLVERLLDVRDNLQRALDQDEGVDIRDGIKSTLEQFDRQLERENVERIEPEPGDAVDPNRHEVLVTVESNQPDDSIAEVYRPGYEMAGKVIRPAQVTVSKGGDRSESGDNPNGENGDGRQE